MPSQNIKNLLIVEGEADKLFVKRFLQRERLHLNLKVQPVTPVDIDPAQTYTTKGAVFNVLENILKSLADGSIERLGILVDMDFRESSRMPIKQQNLDQLSQKLNSHDFSLRQQTNDDKGIFFENDEFEYPIGVWLMPDNQNEGYFESWIKQNIDASQLANWQLEEAFINSFDEGHFKPHVIDKALIFTWLAIQPKPSQDLSYCLKPEDKKPIGKLLDNTQPSYQNFKQWLVNTFA